MTNERGRGTSTNFFLEKTRKVVLGEELGHGESSNGRRSKNSSLNETIRKEART